MPEEVSIHHTPLQIVYLNVYHTVDAHTSRSWWAAERVAAQRLWRALGNATDLPTDLPANVALYLVATALGGNAPASARNSALVKSKFCLF